MPDLSPTIDAYSLSVGTSWAGTVGDGTTANTMNTTGTFRSSGINAIDLSAFNATQVERYFVEFNTSGVTSTPSSGTFKLYGGGSGTADVICAQASFASAGALTTGDWDSWNEASPVAYTNELETWSTSGYNTFTLTAAALSAMASLDEFQMVCMEADNDYDQTSAGSGLVSISAGYYTSNETDAGKRPVLSYVEAVTSTFIPTLDLKGGSLTITGGNFTIK